MNNQNKNLSQKFFHTEINLELTFLQKDEKPRREKEVNMFLHITAWPNIQEGNALNVKKYSELTQLDK